MIEESKAAAKWWADQLRGLPAGPDDPNGGVLLALGRAIIKTLDPAQVDVFERILTVSIINKVQNNWPESDLMLGSYLRTIECDWGPSKDFDDAINESGIKSAGLRFPVKTVMWINPGSVTVRVGYGSPIQTVYNR